MCGKRARDRTTSSSVTEFERQDRRREAESDHVREDHRQGIEIDGVGEPERDARREREVHAARYPARIARTDRHHGLGNEGCARERRGGIAEPFGVHAWIVVENGAWFGRVMSELLTGPPTSWN